jgi:tetratricopeptide (TPR) repeat protein
VFFLIGGCIPALVRFGVAGGALMLAALLELGAGWSWASEYRSNFLVLDYGRAMLRSLPLNSVLFMDGGDDAFYSLAMLQNVMRARRDVELHDRGGLVFPNPYGDDFRSLPKDQKSARRWEVERARRLEKPLYYVTMDPHVLPGVPTFVNGLIVQTAPVSVSMWPFYAARSLYPPRPATFRMRALAAFFPYSLARTLEDAGQWRAALAAYDRAIVMGAGVDWLQTNLSYEYGQWGYRELVAGRYDAAEAIYRRWIRFEPNNIAAESNLGVVLEKAGRLAEARAQYERAAALFPNDADPVFNLSVLAWKRGDWPEVVRDLEEVLRRDPKHPQATNYLIQAQLRLKGGAR